jgi:hypothetical protein
MTSLTAKRQSFIKLMTESEELARRGFDLILKRTDFEQFFDSLKDAGLFDARHNSGPANADREGYFYIPYWSALNYLAAVAKLSGEKNDIGLANKVMGIVRSVSSWRDPVGLPRQNYHTSRKFAEVLGAVPTASVTLADIAFIEIWLGDRLEQGMVVQALDQSAMSRFLASSSPTDWEKAAEILRLCTADYRLGEDLRKRASATEAYWLKELLHHHSATFGMKIGARAASILLARVREVYSSDGHKRSSAMYRAAIEDHEQNFRWREDENWSVEGLRDVTLSWCESDANGARSFVESLLRDSLEILRRLGIFVLAKQWAHLHELYSRFLGPELFNPGNLHELYNLLQERFADQPEQEKAATVHAIRQIPAPAWSKDPSRSLKRIQRQWLSAIAGKGHAEADQWLAELDADSTLGVHSDHPEFASYSESRVGPGSTPYSAQEIVAFAHAGLIVEKLNSFEEKDDWNGPTLEGLVSAVDEAVRVSPELFLKLLPEFIEARRPFQHCLISGLKHTWEAKDRKQNDIDWNLGWEGLIAFFEQLVGNPEFWEEKLTDNAAFVGTQDSVASDIAEFLDVGTRNDERAYPSEFLPRTWLLIEILLDKARAIDQQPDDAMFEAINSVKGKAVEALFSQALRICRAGDKANGSHAEVWAAVRHLFESELKKCKNTNYEFSTLAGAYLPQLDYMSREWVRANLGHIFPPESPSNSVCAIDGLAYAQFTRPVYELLAEQGVLDRSLRYELKGRNPREKVLERIAAAYLWGAESLESSRFSYLFETGHASDLEVIVRVFWSVRDSDLSALQKERILEYWNRCVTWSRNLAKAPATLLSALSTLSVYVTTADGKERELLEAVAPYVHDGYNSHSFFEELGRLVESSPEGVSNALGKTIDAHVPPFDFEDRLKLLLLKLADHGMREDVIRYAERVRMQDVFDHLTRKQ